MDLRADISIILCCFLQVAFGQSFEALLRSLGGFSGGDGTSDMYQGRSGAGMGFGGGGGGGGGGSSCPYLPHGDKLKFTQRVNGQTFVRTCAPGTMYDAQTCGCVNIPKSASAGQRIGSPTGPGSNNMGMINDLVKQMQNRAMRPPTPSRVPTAPASRPQPMKPTSRSPTNHMNTIRQLASDTPQPFVPGTMSMDVMNMDQTGTANPIKYPPDPDPFMGQMYDPFMMPAFDPFMAHTQDFTGSFGSMHSPGNDIMSMFQDTVLPQYRNNHNFANPPTFDTNFNIPSLPAKVTTPPVTPSPKPDIKVGGVPINFASSMTSKQVQRKRRPPTNGIPLYKKVPKLANPDTDPLADLLMQLSSLPSQTQKPKQTFNTKTSLAGLKSLPATSGFESLPGRGGAMGGTNAAALLGALGGGAMGGAMGGAGAGGGPDISALLAALGGGGGTPSLGGNAASLLGLGGGGSSSLLGDTPRTMDMTSLFNLQGRASPVGLAGLSGVNMMRLQELDRQGVIDLSDLSPGGAIAASRHFQG